jgi:Superinfection immunity protein
MDASPKKIQKFIDRNQTPLIAAGGLCLLLLMAVAGIPELQDGVKSVFQGAGTVLAALLAFVMILCFVVIGLGLYIAPTIVALTRKHPNAGPVAIINILLGWTLIGYAIALAWAFMAIEGNEAK